MALGGRMRDSVDVYRRTSETDDWVNQSQGLSIGTRPVPTTGKRSEIAMIDPTITHIGRMPAATVDVLKDLDRVKRIRDGQEFVVRQVRLNEMTGTGHTEVWLAAVDSAIG